MSPNQKYPFPHQHKNTMVVVPLSLYGHFNRYAKEEPMDDFLEIGTAR